jgi:hypothetical protein
MGKELKLGTARSSEVKLFSLKVVILEDWQDKSDFTSLSKNLWV